MPEPVTRVHQFLRLTTYYRRFISQFAKVAAPLHHITRKGVEFVWMEDCQVAFNTLKVKLTQAPILAYPDFDRKFVLEANASVCLISSRIAHTAELSVTTETLWP